MPAETPLSDITVIELGHSVAAPFAGEILGDLGATVIKIEKHDGGDDARKWAPPYWHGLSAIFQSLNRNKLSVTVDLRDPAEREKAGERKRITLGLRPSWWAWDCCSMCSTRASNWNGSTRASSALQPPSRRLPWWP